MKILVLNSGSSSIKFQLFSMVNQEVIASGIVEKIGETIGRILFHSNQAKGQDYVFDEKIADHKTGMNRIVELITDSEIGVIQQKSEVDAIGHRVVHGGETFQSPTIIDDNVLEAIRENIPLAPLHNPANIVGIEVSQQVFKQARQVAVFDTAFHHTIPPKAHLYALPYELYKSMKIRKYGFHGTSHHYVAEAAANYLKKDFKKTNLITIHLGNGGSITAVRGGKSIDTSMGMTPLEGLIMGTRSGDIDPAIPYYIASNSDNTIEDIDEILNKNAGLKGICGLNDMREILSAKENGDKKAALAVEMYCYRIKKYIGAYSAILESVDAIVFTAGIGEHSHPIRKEICDGLSGIGIVIDNEKNQEKGKGIRELQSPKSKVKILLIPTNEELKIALEAYKIVK